ncbi:MAG: hypothetical protein JW744_02685 [Candidatus Diapherotrites archaeon]|uniref:Uncharacterized protein n=1 Tax=Candidatus Iainarchaeum sp. TaxID=3101447 RepID=A0A938YUF4_9ARCH|nr:hypothetical protein [Candidatus Diapherotrites archaeon]
MVFNFFLAFLTGFSAKAADELSETKSKLWPKLAFIAALAYGLLAGYLVSDSPEFSTLFLAVICAVLLSGKIDNRQHQLGVSAFILAVAFFGLPAIHPLLFAFLLVLGFLDEILNNVSDKLEASAKGPKSFALKIFGLRILMELGCIAVGLATANWFYLIAIAMFDAGYIISGKLCSILATQ